MKQINFFFEIPILFLSLRVQKRVLMSIYLINANANKTTFQSTKYSTHYKKLNSSGTIILCLGDVYISKIGYLVLNTEILISQRLNKVGFPNIVQFWIIF